MTKVRKQKRKKKFRANVNRKRLRNKLQKLPKIECEDIENSWELKRSIRTNLRDMGLAYDPNEALKIPSTRAGIKKARKNIIENEEEEDDGAGDEETPADIQREKIHVANKLEADAKAPRERMFRLPKNQVQFVTYLMDKYGDDYKAMARDRKNHYQMTWCQIRAKINTFKSIPEQYAEYLVKSGEIVLEDPETLEETRRKIGEENAKKYCVAKKRKIAKEPKKPIWEVESEEEAENAENLEDENRSSVDANGVKKLKLFSEDEDDEKDEKPKNKKKKIDDKNKNLESFEKLKKKMKLIEKAESSDSDDESGLDGDEDPDGFVNLSELSEEELSEDDVLDDGEFVSDDSE